jgi:hypothetical protein
MNFFALLVILGLGYVAWMLLHQYITGYPKGAYTSETPQPPGDALFLSATSDTSSTPQEVPTSYPDSFNSYDCPSDSSSGGCDAA